MKSIFPVNDTMTNIHLADECGALARLLIWSDTDE